MNQLRAENDWQPRRHADAAPVFAAIDLGTNNCRLLVARAEGGSFRVIDAFSRIVRLGERVVATGALSEAAMARTIAALRVCAAKLRRRGVSHYRGVATQACREARNGPAFLERVRDETGLALDVIGSREEAELALSGCAALLDALVPRGILFDIGGGSTEVLLVEQFAGAWRAVDYVSIPRGVVGYAEQHGNMVSAHDYEKMVVEIQDMLAPFERRHALASQVSAGTVQMVGASGTVTTLAGVHMRLPRYNRAVVDGSWLEFDHVRTASGRIVALDWHARADHPCIGPERADLVVPGCAILEAICRMWPVGRLRVADRGLREGIILGLMRTAAPLQATL
jgi:exopolyphosphatase/guanosine-5'-triphosphate,3'-diphosphate pyrophosphatase